MTSSYFRTTVKLLVSEECFHLLGREASHRKFYLTGITEYFVWSVNTGNSSAALLNLGESCLSASQVTNLKDTSLLVGMECCFQENICKCAKA